MAEAIKVMQQRVEKRKAIADPDLENENDEKEGDEIEVLKRQKKIAGHQVKNKPDREAVQGIITKMQTEVSAYNLSELDSFVVKPNKELSELTKQLTMELNHATPGFVAVVMKQIAVAIRKRRFDLQEAIKAEAIKKQKERADAALVALKERKFQEEQNPTTTFEKAKSEEEEAKMTPAERRAALNASYEPMRDCVGQVIVKMLTDKMINVDINPATLVSDVMDAITDAEGIPPDQQRLIFSGKQLEAEQFLSALKIRNMDIIHIVLRLRGGSFVFCCRVLCFFVSCLFVFRTCRHV
jgi:hypothetical protein